MGCDCGEKRLITIQVITDIGKKKSSQVILMKDLSVIYDATEFLKIIDKMKYETKILKSDGEVILHDNQSEEKK